MTCWTAGTATRRAPRQRARLPADKDGANRYVIEVNFFSESQARHTDARSETRAWTDKLRAVTQGQPEYRNYELSRESA
ncbi:MAG: hypothetical protein M3O70_24025 [Actinomycetota bacterium]|nr:hypothetical protein [Actinomycetota bacterium]